ncbi:hypothetical protein CEXT_132201 [Caerostris extrusa]|uniref:Uncharacterized protein n=1 Tax=Caerostris extrusa TaxID=172846 RepID=A0AAV4Y2D8_CAEEX|nr:hypothetical protein CEXT_132201 [Caerostris extrusa]
MGSAVVDSARFCLWTRACVKNVVEAIGGCRIIESRATPATSSRLLLFSGWRCRPSERSFVGPSFSGFTAHHKRDLYPQTLCGMNTPAMDIFVIYCKWALLLIQPDFVYGRELVWCFLDILLSVGKISFWKISVLVS